MMNFRIEPSTQQLGKLLERERIISKEQFRDIIRRAKEDSRTVADVLYEELPPVADKLLEIFGELYDTPITTLRDKVITPYVLNLIPKDVAEQHAVIVFKKIQNVIHVATTDPANSQTIDFIKRHTKLEPEVFLTTPDDLRHGLRRYQTELSEEFEKIIADSARDAEASHESAENLAQHLPIITMVNSVIERALNQRASDVHIEPGLDDVVIRFRIDGLLRKILILPKALMAPMTARIKLIANLKIDEHRLPQDGRFSFSYGNHTVAIRVSVVPTLHGSKIVLRLLDTKKQEFSLRNLGLNQHHYAILKQEITKPNGLILVTGPTGSGKTTTLYTLLRLLNTEEVNICTVEDPVEYGLDGISQTQVNPAAGLTFANGLRSLLRQDPNVIMVGEIRDGDTADITVNAAMTGHLVLSTLHTNSAAQTIQRLVEMGVQPYVAASTMNVLIAQRLVRKVCRFCRTDVRLTEKIIAQQEHNFPLPQIIQKLQRHNLLPATFDLRSTAIAHGRGCDKCQGSGYQGRVGIYQIFSVNEQLHAAIVRDPSPESIAAEAERQGLLTMADDGVYKVLTGVTTFAEVLRVTK